MNQFELGGNLNFILVAAFFAATHISYTVDSL